MIQGTFGIFPDDQEKEEAVKFSKAERDEVILWYAKQKNVPDEKLKIWCKQKSNYVENINPAKFILEYCGSVEAAKRAITNCRIERERKKLEWSLAGDVVRNIQNYAPKDGGTGAAKQWH